MEECASIIAGLNKERASSVGNASINNDVTNNEAYTVTIIKPIATYPGSGLLPQVAYYTSDTVGQLCLSAGYNSALQELRFARILASLSPDESVVSKPFAEYKKFWQEFLASSTLPSNQFNLAWPWTDTVVVDYLENTLVLCQRALGIQMQDTLDMRDFCEFLQYINRLGIGSILIV